jgi:hypothetical protein
MRWSMRFNGGDEMWSFENMMFAANLLSGLLWTTAHERSCMNKHPARQAPHVNQSSRSTSCSTLGNASHRNNHLLGSVSSRQARLPGALACSFTPSLDPLSNTIATTYLPSEMPLPGTQRSRRTVPGTSCHAMRTSPEVSF